MNRSSPPGKPSASPIQKPPVWPVFVTYAITMVVLLFGLASMTSSHAFVTFLEQTTRPPNPEELNEAMTMVYESPSVVIYDAALKNFFLLAAAVIAALASVQPFRKRLRLHRGELRPIYFVPSTLLIIGLGSSLNHLPHMLGYVGRIATATQRATTSQFGWLAMLSTAAGVVEEVFFRGYMQTRLSERWRRSTAVTLTAVAFAWIHGDLFLILIGLVLGMALGWITEGCGSIYPAMAAHCLNNLLVTLSHRYLSGLWHSAAHMPVLIGLLVSAGAILWMILLLPKKAAEYPAAYPEVMVVTNDQEKDSEEVKTRHTHD